jgi:hypothetical protein
MKLRLTCRSANDAVNGLDCAWSEAPLRFRTQRRGKSTTIKMLTGLLGPDGGVIRILDQDISDAKGAIEVRRRIGVVPEQLALFDNLTAREYLTFVGRMYRLPLDTVRDRCRELLVMMSLDNEEKKLALEYSHGMKKKLALAAALIPNPDVLFLDERTRHRPFHPGIAGRPQASRAARGRCSSSHIRDRGEALHGRWDHRRRPARVPGHDGRGPPPRVAGGPVPRVVGHGQIERPSVGWRAECTGASCTIIWLRWLTRNNGPHGRLTVIIRVVRCSYPSSEPGGLIGLLVGFLHW